MRFEADPPDPELDPGLHLSLGEKVLAVVALGFGIAVLVAVWRVM